MQYLLETDCKSKLGKRMQAFRADRPSEYLMDEFISGVEDLESRLAAMQEVVESAIEWAKEEGWFDDNEPCDTPECHICKFGQIVTHYQKGEK